MQKSTRFLTTWLLVLLSVGFAYAELCKGSKVPKADCAVHAVIVRVLETVTSIDLLPKLNAEALKWAVASELWPRN